MSVTEIVEQVRAAVQAERPSEVWGGGALVSRLAADLDVGRIDGALNTGVVEHEPADLVITVGSGMPVAELDQELASLGQECPLDDPFGSGATVGGRVATGLGGFRQLGCGPVRDWILGATLVTGDGRIAAAGGRTVKNVTGYDLPRLLCGSWGTLGVMVDVTLKVRPRPRWSGWFTTTAPVESWIGQLYAPASVLVGPARSWVLLEGHPKDAEEAAAAVGMEASEAPPFPRGIRFSVPRFDLAGWLDRLPPTGWLAEWGVGVVHLDTGLLEASLRDDVDAAGGRVLRLGEPALADDLRPAGANHPFQRRLKQEFDPAGVLAPWRFQT